MKRRSFSAQNIPTQAADTPVVAWPEQRSRIYAGENRDDGGRRRSHTVKTEPMNQPEQRAGTPTGDTTTAASRRRIGRFVLIRVLGSGGFATVYLAEDSLLRRQVALKLLHEQLADDANVVRRFQAEARAAAGLHHPNIVNVYDVGESEQGRPYLVTEFLSGSPLSRVLAQSGALPIEFVVRIITQLASALEHMHRQGIIHRDVKPSNVMLDESGHVTLMDFGSARELTPETRRTLSGEMLGTLGYMAPEQISGDAITPATDVYALGLLTYEMLAGEPPFTGAPARVLHDQVYSAPPLLRARNAEVSPAMERTIVAALAKDPRERPPSAMAFANRLAAPPSTPEARRRPEDRPAPRVAAVRPPVHRPVRATSDTEALDAHRPSDVDRAARRKTALAWSGAGVLILGMFLLALLGVSQLAGRPRTTAAKQNTWAVVAQKSTGTPAAPTATAATARASAATPTAVQSTAAPPASAQTFAATPSTADVATPVAAPPPATVPDEPAPAAASSRTAPDTPAACADSISGQWQFTDQISYGAGVGQQYVFTVRLSQQGNQVTGSGTLNLAGRLDGCVLRAAFAQPGGEGAFTWSFSPDGSQFNGTFSAPSYGNGGVTIGRRLGST
jgi:tRNA A-37 threonylcarbamoyl transferase component Bud32